MKRSVYGWILESATLLSLIWSFYPLYFYRNFTGEIPIRYNIYGQAVRWGDPSGLLLVSFMALMFYGGSFVFEKCLPELNYPIPVTEKNAESLYGLMLGLIRHSKFFAIFLLAYASNVSLFITFFEKESTAMFAALGIGAVMMVVIFIYIFKMMALKDK